MLVSVVVPTFRRPPLLLRCLEALFRQNLPLNGNATSDSPAFFEILVVDDGNDAATKHAVETSTPPAHVRLRYLGQPTRRGPAAARNRGWQAAKADYIAFTDDDCLPEPDWLYHGVMTLRTGAQVVTGQLRVPLADRPTDHERTAAFLETAEFVTANCFCRRSALARVGGLAEDFDIAWREDSDLQFKFLRAGIPITKEPAAVILHPVRAAPWWASLKDERKNRYDALLYKRHPRLFRERIPAYKSLVTQYYLTVMSFLALLVGLLAGIKWLILGAGVVWLSLGLLLIVKRLRGTSTSWAHIGQVVLTSLLTPFLSVYWRLYGAWKYRVLYL